MRKHEAKQEMAFELGLAKVDHLRWRNQGLSTRSHLSVQECRFDRWLSASRKQFRASAEFKAMTDAHQRFHQELVSVEMANGLNDVPNTGLQRASSELLFAIEAMERTALETRGRSAGFQSVILLR